MKIFSKIALSLLLSLAGTLSLHAQFEGKILFTLSYQSLPDKSMEAMLPKEMTIWVKDHLSRTEQGAMMGSKTVVIADAKKGTATVLMDLMGQKFAMESDANDKEAKEAEKKTKVTKTGEKKKIAGYDCEKAILETPDGKMNVWYSKDFKFRTSQSMSGPYSQIDGGMLEFEVNQQGLRMTVSAKEVIKEPVSDAKFNIPSDYKKMTKEELGKLFGQ